MECKNPSICAEKHRRWKQNQSRLIPIGDKLFECFKKKLKDGSAILEASKHFRVRSYERSINRASIINILNEGWVIEYIVDNSSQMVRLLVMGYVKTNFQTYRPLHMVLEIESENRWEIITAYSPYTMPYKWSEDFQERVCFCHNDEDR